MNKWFIIRENLSYGPYTTEQMLAMEAQAQLFVGDSIFDSERNIYLSIEQAQLEWHPPARKTKRKKSHKGLITFGIFILVIVAGIIYYNQTKMSDNMTLGRRQQAVNASVPSTGGVVAVNDPKSPVNGMKITVANGSYKDKIDFSISTRPIKSHAFGPKFTPISPLITIENGHKFSNEPMTVTIPIKKSSDEFAMGFYYDTKTGKLEGIPTIELDNNHITLIMNHFSEPVIAKVKKSELDNMQIDTGFTPGIDDWQFVNIGSQIAPGGFCSGSTISAMWYYTEVYQKNSEPRLNGRFDNNDYGQKTPKFWWDDSWGIRFASMVQKTTDWDSKSRVVSKFFGKYSADMTMYSFAYSMFLTKEPQYVEIRREYIDKDGKPQNGGHAIVAYKIEDNKIYVADPNKPGKADRYISAGTKGFSPYSSGANATAIQEDGEVFYPQIYYIAKSALNNYDEVKSLYEDMKKGKAGDGVFAKFDIKIAKKIDPATNTVTEWAPCPDELKLSTADTAKVDPIVSGKLVFGIFTSYSNQQTAIYKGLQNCSLLVGNKKSPNGIIVSTVTLDNGINDLALYNTIDYSTDNTGQSYSDFKRIKVIYNEKLELKFTEDSYKAFLHKKVKFIVKESSSPPDVKYVWNFGFGEEQKETEIPEIEYTYKNEGDNTVTCTMVNKKDSKVIATARAPITVLDLYGKWNFNYTIREAGPIDFIINSILKVFVNIINGIFPEAAIPPDTKVTIKGTVIGCELTIIQPDPSDKSNKIKISLKQLTSSTDYVDVVEEPLLGEIKITEDDKVVIEIKSQNIGEGDSSGSFKFTGQLINGQMTGDFNAAFVMSGDFSAAKK